MIKAMKRKEMKVVWKARANADLFNCWLDLQKIVELIDKERVESQQKKSNDEDEKFNLQSRNSNFTTDRG
jgi:hypothetical protein